MDLVALMGELQSSLPDDDDHHREAITISTAGVAGAAAATPGGLDTSGLPRIGTITISGTGQTLDDLADYIDRLQVVPGLVDVLPVTNTGSPRPAYRVLSSASDGLTERRAEPSFRRRPGDDMSARAQDKRLWLGGGAVAAVLIVLIGWFVVIDPELSAATATREQADVGTDAERCVAGKERQAQGRE